MAAKRRDLSFGRFNIFHSFLSNFKLTIGIFVTANGNVRIGRNKHFNLAEKMANFLSVIEFITFFNSIGKIKLIMSRAFIYRVVVRASMRFRPRISTFNYSQQKYEIFICL